MSFFSIGLSGLSVAQQNLLTTQHNIVNANTEGFTRQRVLQSVDVGIMTGGGAIGQGVRSASVERLYDQFIAGKLNADQAMVSELDAFYSQATQLDDLLADVSAGLSPGIQDFFSGVQKVATNPSLLTSRQTMISSAETLVSRVRLLDMRLQDFTGYSNAQIKEGVAAVNGYADQIASLNRGIMSSESAYGQPANDLRDKRDQIIAELNKIVRVTTSANNDGSINLFIGSGQQLVVGASVVEMTANPSKADPSKLAIGLKSGNTEQELPDDLITGGTLGGLLSFRNSTLSDAQTEIGRVVASMALTFNAQQALGQDLNGKINGEAGFKADFFDVPAPKSQANANNTGSGNIAVVFAPLGSVDGHFATELRATNYEVKFTSAVAYTVTSFPGGQSVSGPPFDGLQISIPPATVIQPGDRFLIKPYADLGQGLKVNSSIAADPRLVAAAAPVVTSAATANTGSIKLAQGTVESGYSIAGLPVTMTLVTTSTTLTGLPAGWEAVYADGSTQPGGAAVPLINTVLPNPSSPLASIRFQGMTFAISGASANGDTFTIARNTKGIEDGRNANRLAGLQTQKTLEGATATFQSAYAGFVADVGIQTREAGIQLDARTAIHTQTQATRDSLSAVNLDEEAANLLKFQQAYQASAKILEIGGKLFDSLLAMR